jgi:hypothetical protein
MDTPKFIQLAVTTVDDGETLYALDEHGRVWGLYTLPELAWHPLCATFSEVPRSPWELVDDDEDPEEHELRNARNGRSAHDGT